MNSQSKNHSEYHKLDLIDQKVLRWTVKHAPSSLTNWIEYTVAGYLNRKGIVINAEILLEEIKSKPEPWL